MKNHKNSKTGFSVDRANIRKNSHLKIWVKFFMLLKEWSGYYSGRFFFSSKSGQTRIFWRGVARYVEILVFILHRTWICNNLKPPFFQWPRKMLLCISWSDFVSFVHFANSLFCRSILVTTSQFLFWLTVHRFYYISL